MTTLRKTLAQVALMVIGLAATSPHPFAYEPDHLAQLLATNSCAGCDLREADLSQVDLDFADLTGANLEAARLDGASLICARMEGANLIGADLHGANIMGTRFTGADLTAANLSSAVLLRNALWEAVRDDVNLTGAIFFRSMSDGGLWNVNCGDERAAAFGG